MSLQREVLAGPARALLALGVLTFLLSMLRHLPTLQAEQDIGHECNISVRYQGQFQRAWDEEGFFALGGRPIMHLIPTKPISGKTYVNHPPLVHWIYRVPTLLFGRSLVVLRSTAAVFCSAFCALLVVFIGIHLGWVAALAAMTFCVSSPMLLFYGQMANFESPLLLMFLALFLLCRLRGRHINWLIMLIGFLAVFTDWIAVLALPGVALMSPSTLKLRRVSLAGIAMGLSLCSFFGLFWFWEGSELLSKLNDALSSTQTPGESVPWPKDALIQPLMGLNRTYGVLALALFVISWPGIHSVARKAKMTAVDSLQCAFTILGVSNVVLFISRSYNHEFWWIYFLPAVAIAIARVAQQLFRRRKIWAVLLILLLPAQLPWAIQKQSAFVHSDIPQTMLELVNGLFDADTFVVLDEYDSNWSERAIPWVYDGVVDHEKVVQIFELFQTGALERRRLVLGFKEEDRTEYQTDIEFAFLNGAKLLNQGGFVFLVFER